MLKDLQGRTLTSARYRSPYPLINNPLTYRLTLSPLQGLALSPSSNTADITALYVYNLISPSHPCDPRKITPLSVAYRVEIGI